MQDILIIAMIAAAAGLGVFNTVRHLRGKGGCCGGGSYTPRKKKLAKVLYRKRFKISGMHCEHCRNRVTEAVNDIEGVSGLVNLKKGELTVSYAADVPDEVIIARIKKAGYQVV